MQVQIFHKNVLVKVNGNARDASSNNKQFGDTSSWRRKDEGSDPLLILQPHTKFVKSNIGVLNLQQEQIQALLTFVVPTVFTIRIFNPQSYIDNSIRTSFEKVSC
jgi:hypothetical protein